MVITNSLATMRGVDTNADIDTNTTTITVANIDTDTDTDANANANANINAHANQMLYQRSPPHYLFVVGSHLSDRDVAGQPDADGSCRIS